MTEREVNPGAIEIPPSVAQLLDEAVRLSRYGAPNEQTSDDNLRRYLEQKLSKPFSESAYHAAMTGRMSAAHMHRLRETVKQKSE